MSLIALWVIMGYMMWKVSVPWFIWVIFATTIIADIVHVVYEVGKENGNGENL